LSLRKQAGVSMRVLERTDTSSRLAIGARGYAITLALLCLLVVCTRMLPLAISQYPFNNDGITESRIASDIVESGHLSYPEGAFYIDTHSVITPAYDVLLAFAATAMGFTPFDVAQISVAVTSLITVVGTYLLALYLTKDPKAALCAAMVLSLFGTFVFLTGSTWKESLGVAMMVLLVIAFVRRESRVMMALELTILFLLPFVHHLVCFLSFLLIAYLTMWSVLFGLRAKSLRRRHYIDIAVIGVALATTFVTYDWLGMDRLSYFSSVNGLVTISMAFIAISAAVFLLLHRKRHTRLTLSPFPSVVMLSVLIWDHFNPIFPYSSGYPSSILFLGLLAGVLLSVAWYGLERTFSSNSIYRSVPIGLLVPVLTLFIYALISGPTLFSHQILYRSFDFADMSIALGVSMAVASFRDRARRQFLLVILVLVVLLLSFPFGYMSDSLIGVRHDTQAYEVDSLSWANEALGNDKTLQTDERLAYSARALFDFAKSPGLPVVLDYYEIPNLASFCMLEMSWVTKGVNSYPNGYVVLDEEQVLLVLEMSNVLYAGGEDSDLLVIFRASPIGIRQIG
jgi:hypothetical protein